MIILYITIPILIIFMILLSKKETFCNRTKCFDCVNCNKSLQYLRVSHGNPKLFAL